MAETPARSAPRNVSSPWPVASTSPSPSFATSPSPRVFHTLTFSREKTPTLFLLASKALARNLYRISTSLPIEVALHIIEFMRENRLLTEEVVSKLVDFNMKELEVCPGLKWAVNNNSMAIVAHTCTQLTTVRLREAYAITDEGLLELARNRPLLTELHLHRCSQVTDSGIQKLGKLLGNRLEAFSVVHCPNTTKLGVRFLVSSCPRLRELAVSAASEEDVLYIGKQCRELVKFSLEGFTVGDGQLRAIARTMPRLLTLDLSRSAEITDKGVKMLAAKCTRLQQLRLAHCYKLSDAALHHLAGRELRLLDVRGCTGIAEKAIEEFKASGASGTVLHGEDEEDRAARQRHFRYSPNKEGKLNSPPVSSGFTAKALLTKSPTSPNGWGQGGPAGQGVAPSASLSYLKMRAAQFREKEK